MKNYAAKQLYSILIYPLLFVLLLWTIFFLQETYHWHSAKLGVLPRSPEGLLGIFTSVFIHGDIFHIASNSLPLLVLGMMVFYFYKKIAIQSIFWIWGISGLWLWIGGRNSDSYPLYHIGASTLIYGLASFLFFSGVFRKHLRLMVVSALVVFMYGGIVWGIFPGKPEISWEGHLFGVIAGILVAFNFRHEGPKPKVYKWEEEEEESESTEITINAEEETGSNNIQIHYHYKEKDKEEN